MRPIYSNPPTIDLPAPEEVDILHRQALRGRVFMDSFCSGGQWHESQHVWLAEYRPRPGGMGRFVLAHSVGGELQMAWDCVSPTEAVEYYRREVRIKSEVLFVDPFTGKWKKALHPTDVTCPRLFAEGWDYTDVEGVPVADPIPQGCV